MLIRIVLSAFVLCAALIAVTVQAQQDKIRPRPIAPITSRGSVKGHVGPLPPLPYEGYPSPRPIAMAQAAYEFAARRPEVLQHVPCFCGCEKNGHTGNESCFVKSRDPRGQVLAWDSHGYGWAICIDVARDAMQLYNSGASVSQIRAAIDQKYAARFPTATPTPKPPGKK